MQNMSSLFFGNCLAVVALFRAFGVFRSSNFSLWTACVSHKLKFELRQDVLLPDGKQKKDLLDSYIFVPKGLGPV